MIEELSNEDLADAWRDHNEDMKSLMRIRDEIGEELARRLGTKPEGAQTHSVGGYKVTLTQRVNRTLDAKKWESIKENIPEGLRPVNYAPKLDIKGAKYLEDNEPDVWAEIAKAVTVKPGKVSVYVKEVSDD